VLLPGIEPRPPVPYPVAIPTELSRLPYIFFIQPVCFLLENCSHILIAPDVNFVLIWLMNHDVERLLLPCYPLPILMMSPQGQVHTVVMQLEPALLLINPLGDGTLSRMGTVVCTARLY
jgi:hypothetical protein